MCRWLLSTCRFDMQSSGLNFCTCMWWTSTESTIWPLCFKSVEVDTKQWPWLFRWWIGEGGTGQNFPVMSELLYMFVWMSIIYACLSQMQNIIIIDLACNIYWQPCKVEHSHRCVREYVFVCRNCYAWVGISMYTLFLSRHEGVYVGKGVPIQRSRKDL